MRIPGDRALAFAIPAAGAVFASTWVWPQFNAAVFYPLTFLLLTGNQERHVWILAGTCLFFVFLPLMIQVWPHEQRMAGLLLSLPGIAVACILSRRHCRLADSSAVLMQRMTGNLLELDQQLDEKKEYFYNLIDNLMEGVQLVSRDHKYLYVNNALVRQSGYAKEELLGYSMEYRYPGIERTELMEVIDRCMETQTATHYTSHFVYPDGKRSSFDLFMHPVEEGVFILSVDISRHTDSGMRASERISELESELRELELLARTAEKQISALLDWGKNNGEIIDNDSSLVSLMKGLDATATEMRLVTERGV